jgi:multiple antibiotic resistance protein
VAATDQLSDRQRRDADRRRLDVFGDMGGNFYAVDAASGRKLRGQHIGGAIGDCVVTYTVNGVQKVAGDNRLDIPRLAGRDQAREDRDLGRRGYSGERMSDETTWCGLKEVGSMPFELGYVDIAIIFFLTLGPLKAILPFARATRGADPAFKRNVAWRAVMIGTVIVVAVALLGPVVLPNWHVTAPAIVITCGIILFLQALRIVMQTPPPPGSTGQQSAPAQPSPAIAVFPLAIPAIVTAPGIAAIAAIAVLDRNEHDLVHQAIVVALLIAVMALNLLTLWNNDAILRHGLAGVLPVVGWVLAVLQASLAVQMMLYSLRLLEILRWPAP